MTTISAWRDLIAADRDTIADGYRHLCKTQEAEMGMGMHARDHFEALSLVATILERASVLVIDGRFLRRLPPCLFFLCLRCAGGSALIAQFDVHNDIIWTTSALIETIIASGACPGVSMRRVDGGAYVWWSVVG